MVKIPALELDGQNWKIYRAKLLEAAATYYCLDVLAGRPDDGTDDWHGSNALLWCTFMETAPPTIYVRIRYKTAHEIYNYLADCFRDYDPIQELCLKKFAARTNDAKRYSSAESPTSENAATGAAEREDLPTKDLTRGTKDVDGRIVRCEDPRTSSEASAKGTSAESANGTLVLLTGELHETQNIPQNSLPLTPRLPIDGKPGECKQEAMDGVVTAGRTNGTAQSANPPETDADVDRTALLGGEPAERASGVDEGDEEREHESQIQQTIFYCKESRQHDENANGNVPKAHGLPLEGEWLVCASGEASDWNGDANASNAAIERVVSPSESRVAEDTPGVESEGCEGGTSGRESVDEAVECCQQLCVADGDPGRGIEPADTPNESKGLVTVSIESESPDSGGIPRVHLGRTRLHGACHADRLGNGADASSCQKDESKGWTDTLDVSNGAETTGVSHGDGAETYLSVRDAKRVVHATDGVGNHADASSGHTHVPCVETDSITTANESEIVSTPRKKTKPPNSPMETAKRHPDEPNGCGSRADWSSVRTDAHCGGNETERVRTRQIGSKMQYSPGTRETTTLKRPRRWRRVSADGIHVYVPWNVPIEVLGTASRKIVFGRAESGDEAIAPSVEGERAGDGDGDGYGDDGDDGDEGDTTSGGDVDSFRVEAALLAGDSQLERQSRRTRPGNLPVSSVPPTYRERRPYGLVRRRRRRGRLKIERINVSQAQQRETTHLGRACAMQPHGTESRRAYGVIRPRRRRGRIKIAPTNVSRTRNGGNAYLGRANAMRSTWRPKRQIKRLDEFTFESRKQGERWRDDGDYG